ncbi:MAG: hypothetical protein JJU26_05035 [Oceanicaulis sp.]|uniref:hypothetical protein n=1 Tax=Glycocaulis sp. TaxID=1969725 RepID=UPI0025C1E247|nr:hypothetical protein [Glycocaulis sp.]MCC5981065.1 hypothetical protein [Oceanicaulis sp.]MCH8522658.1 hypothetical protein [Glycocaulis sp.]
MPDDNNISEGEWVRRILIWTLPLDLGLIGFVAVLLAGWELWTGIGLLIAGALGSLMLIGNHYRIGPDR